MELFNPKLDLAMNFDALTLSSQAKFKELREWKFLSRLKNQIKNYFNSSCKYHCKLFYQVNYGKNKKY